MLGEWGFGRETELWESGAASGLRVVLGPLCPVGLGASRDGPDPPGSWHGDGGQVLACRGSDPPPPPAAGGTRDSSGLGGLGAPAKLCQTRCARGVVPGWEKRGGPLGFSWVLYPKRLRGGPRAKGASHKPQSWGGGGWRGDQPPY